MGPSNVRPGSSHQQFNGQTQKLTILGAILLCTLISGLLGDSLIAAWSIEIGLPTPRAWRWLLGSETQTFSTQTFSLLFGIALLGFAFGGTWFLAAAGFHWIRRRFFTNGR